MQSNPPCTQIYPDSFTRNGDIEYTGVSWIMINARKLIDRDRAMVSLCSYIQAFVSPVKQMARGGAVYS